METSRLGKTSINHVCLRDNVILKRVTEHSVIAIRSARKEEDLVKNDAELKALIVVAYGPDTKHIEIGNNVTVNFSSGLQEVKVLNNYNDFLDVRKAIMDIKVDDIKNADTVEIHKYYKLSFYNIDTIVLDYNMSEPTKLNIDVDELYKSIKADSSIIVTDILD